LRPVPEQAICLAYVPRPPALHGLNLTSWFVYTLCDGRDEVAIAADYFSAVASSGGPAATPTALEAALLQLETLGLIRRSAGNPTEEL
jgi:hypothetical protein